MSEPTAEERAAAREIAHAHTHYQYKEDSLTDDIAVALRTHAAAAEEKRIEAVAYFQGMQARALDAEAIARRLVAAARDAHRQNRITAALCAELASSEVSALGVAVLGKETPR